MGLLGWGLPESRLRQFNHGNTRFDSEYFTGKAGARYWQLVARHLRLVVETPGDDGLAFQEVDDAFSPDARIGRPSAPRWRVSTQRAALARVDRARRAGACRPSAPRWRVSTQRAALARADPAHRAGACRPSAPRWRSWRGSSSSGLSRAVSIASWATRRGAARIAQGSVTGCGRPCR